MAETLHDRMHAAIRDVPDFPKPGILFKDITPLLADPALLSEVIEAMTRPYRRAGVTHVVAIESRGFFFGPSIAMSLAAALIPARKQGKLPWKTEQEAYELEYGTSIVEMHRDALSAGATVLLVDDILATGGTAAATVRLIQRLGGVLVGAVFMGEIPVLEGRQRLADIPVHTLLKF